MNEILVDTDVVSYLLNGHSFATKYEEMLIGRTPMISFTTVAEMYRGALKKNWGRERMEELRRTSASSLWRLTIFRYASHSLISATQPKEEGARLPPRTLSSQLAQCRFKFRF